MWKKVSVVLTQNVPKLWNKGTIVEVSYAYARNVLLKNNQGKIADNNTIKQVQEKQEKKEKNLSKTYESLKEAVEKIKQEWYLQMKRKAAENNKLYDKVDSKAVSEKFLSDFWVSVPSSAFELWGRIEYLWEYEIWINYQWFKDSITLKVI